MVFASKKKEELWRLASKNQPVPCYACGIQTPMQQQQQPHHPPPRPPQTASEAILRLNTPLPPYSSQPCSIDSSSGYRPNQRLAQELVATETESEVDISMSMSVSGNEESDCSDIKSACSYASSCVDISRDENEARPLPAPAPPYYHQPPNNNNSNSNANPSHNPSMSTATFAFAASMFRNCCGGSGAETSSTNGILTRANLSQRQIPAASTTTCPQPAPAPCLCHRLLKQNFNALLKQLKSKQQAELLLAVKSRSLDNNPPRSAVAANASAAAAASSAHSYLQCILIKSNTPADVEQHFATCQLFFWPDLRCASELRRLPVCPSARDSVYICCNPLHWFRVMHATDTESAYQRSKMLRLRDTDSEGNTQNIERSWTMQSTNNNNINNHNHGHSISSISILKQAESQLYVPSIESFTTDGKDRNACSQAWCQIAYWELGNRVGEFFEAKKSAVNIYKDGPIDCSGDSMCLRDLTSKQQRMTRTTTVQNTRQKIGLGVTLSLNCGDVWIYNRSNVPIYVDSPTLSERLDRVCKVMPGYCLKAFETHRAQVLAYKQAERMTQLGPIDSFSMKISFYKGWGYNQYRRQDIMGCPCWLEVHFNHLR
ncbi:Dad [Drosophila busckii]|uniref:Mothers against decapentaplegic homolog n=1 Tax=Drosophila busckii TaxID=30019 RepID=A0A0M4F6K5_DROBS|nr:mothers against decapentaplegic homolog 6 [Drosophila busckii]ALC47700.1 Dad [Drosophila busckii]